MKIPELVYEIRNLARKEEDLLKKDLFYQCAKSLEILGNIAKIGDLIVAEHNAALKPCIDNDIEKKWPIDDESLKMMEEHIKSLVYYKFLDKTDRWPYDNVDIKLFVSKYLQSHAEKESNTE
jgi:hypothetical protein